MKQLFKTLRRLIKSVGVIKWVDKDRGQLDKHEGKPAVAFPCVLIKLNMRCETISQKNQLCTGTVDITVAYDLATVETSGAASDAASERSLEYIDYADAVYDVLQNCVDGQIRSFDRTTFKDEVRPDGLSVVKMTFNCTFLDLRD